MGFLGKLLKNVLPAVGLGLATDGLSYAVQASWAAAARLAGVTAALDLVTRLGRRTRTQVRPTSNASFTTLDGETEVSRRWVIGTARVDGLPCYVEQRGNDLHLAYILSEGGMPGHHPGHLCRWPPHRSADGPR